MVKRRVFGWLLVGVLLSGAVGLRLLPEMGEPVPLTRPGVPLIFGTSWMWPDSTQGPTLQASAAQAAQLAALAAVLDLAKNHDGSRYCVGLLVGRAIVPVRDSLISELRAVEPGVISANRCRFHLTGLTVDQLGIWPRRAWLVWATEPREAGPDRAVAEIGYHVGSMDGSGWRCFLSRRGASWAVDSTTWTWAS
jgi:hypothetical protein